MIGNTKFVNSLSAPLNNDTLLSLNENQLNSVNNFFEIVYGNRPCRPYIDLDGELLNYSIYEFEEIDRDIKNILSTIPNVSILTSSKHNCKKFDNKNNQFKYINKLSYRLTWYDEVCSNINECRENIKNIKYPYLKKLLENVINLSDAKTEDGLNIDYMVYRSKGKMRCVNAYKDEYDKERINKLLKGNIQQTIISTNYTNMEEIKNEVLEVKTEPIQLKNIVVETKPIKVSINNENIILNDMCKTNYNWTIEKNDNSYKFNHDGMICLVNNSIHSTPHHSCLYYNINTDILEASCFSHGNISLPYDKCSIVKDMIGLKIKPTDWITPELVEDKKENYYISIDDFNKGAYNVANVIHKTLYKTIRLCNEKWYVFNSKNGLWKCVKQPAKYVLDILIKYIDGSILYVSKKLEKSLNEEECEKYREMIKAYSIQYNKVNSNSFFSMLCNILRSHLLDDELEEKLDIKKNYIAFKNGLLNLETLEFRNRIIFEDYLTTTLPYDYNPNYKNEDNEKYLMREFIKICNNDKKFLDYYLSILGFCLIGDADLEKKIFYNVGAGNNGKTLLLDVLNDIIPTYCKKVSSKLLEEKYDKKHKILASVKIARIVWADEFDKKAKVDVRMLKLIADGKTMENEVMFGTTEIINIMFKMFINSNHTPTFDNDGGSENRYNQLAFESHFDDYENDDYENLKFKKNKNLANILKQEYRDDILNILISYANMYYKNKGFCEMPESCKIATKETIEMNDEFKMWFNDNCEVDKKYKISKDEMMEVYDANLKDLKDELNKLGFKYNRMLRIGKDDYGKDIRGGWSGFRYNGEE